MRIAVGCLKTFRTFCLYVKYSNWLTQQLYCSDFNKIISDCCVNLRKNSSSLLVVKLGSNKEEHIS